MRRHRATCVRRSATAGVVAAAFVAAACGTGGGTPEPPDLEVFGPWTGVEADRFEASLRGFEEATGVEVRYLGSADLAAELEARIGDARPPDVALVPQPGLVAELSAQGQLLPLDTTVVETMDREILPLVRRLGDVDGIATAVPYRVSVKSLVWYPPALWADRGWDLPESLAELRRLTRRIAADEPEAGAPVAPWCAGIEAFGATGWVVTDWIEDALARTGGPERYEAWVEGDLDFSDPSVRVAFDVVEELLLVRGHVLGNRAGLVRTPVSEAVLPMLGEAPACAMHRNGSFTSEWLPPGTTVGPDGDLDVFVLPPEVAGAPAPLVAGVDLAVAMTGRPGTQELLAYLASADGGRVWAEAGGFVGGRVGEAHTAGSLGARVAALVADAERVEIDGSDRMAPAFGSGTFWEVAATWAAGGITTDDALESLDLGRTLAGDP